MPRTACRQALGALLGVCVCASSLGGSLEVRVFDGEQAVPAAVVELLGPALPAPSPAPGIMDQINSEFVPRQLVVTRGSEVSFPNSDVTRHQVYSFSPTKRFELPLYSGTPPDPVRFDSAGVVTLGCNIHDAMIGYIVVVDSDHWSQTGDDGVARLQGLPEGDYRLRIWHERIAAEPEGLTVSVAGEQPAQVDVTLQLKPQAPPRGDERLRALQERFRAIKRD